MSIAARFIKWNRYARPVGTSWRVDKTYIRVKGEWRYLYRAVDKQGNAVDFLELAHKIKKGQFNMSELRLDGGRAQELWQAVLAAQDQRQ